MEDYMNDRVLVVIPARGGSKSILLKNLHQFRGKPLIYWALKASADWEQSTSVIVSSDHAGIRSYVEGIALPKVKTFQQSPESAIATVQPDPVIALLAQQMPCDVVVHVQATSPLITPGDLAGGLELLRRDNLDSVLSGSLQHKFIWRQTPAGGVPLNYDYRARPSRQFWPGEFVENGAFYMTTRNAILASGFRISGRIGLYVMDSALDVDMPEDLI